MSRVMDGPAPAKGWRPSPLLLASMGIHGVAGLGLLARPEAWPVAASALAANHALLTALGMWPRSTWLGPNLVRLPAASRQRGEIAVTFDDGPDPEATPGVLDLLDERGVKASFFCIGERARAHPDLCREIARRGHSVENHSSGHPVSFAFLSVRGFRREIGSAQETLSQLAGQPPRFFRPPAGLRNPLLDPALHALGLQLVTWTRRGFDTRTRDARRVVARLTDGLRAGDILLLHDGGSARTAAGRPVVLEALPAILDAADRAGLSPVTLGKALCP